MSIRSHNPFWNEFQMNVGWGNVNTSFAYREQQGIQSKNQNRNLVHRVGSSQSEVEVLAGA